MSNLFSQVNCGKLSSFMLASCFCVFFFLFSPFPSSYIYLGYNQDECLDVYWSTL